MDGSRDFLNSVWKREHKCILQKYSFKLSVSDRLDCLSSYVMLT